MPRRIKNYSGRNFGRRRTKDKLATGARSILMSKIRSKNTTFELKFISALKKATRRTFRKHIGAIRGKPDIVFTKDKVCIFLDSDFWHGWQYPRWQHLLKNNFWREKIQNNRRRDRNTTAYLRRNGWIVLRFWEHQIKYNTESGIEAVIAVIKRV